MDPAFNFGAQERGKLRAAGDVRSCANHTDRPPLPGIISVDGYANSLLRSQEETGDGPSRSRGLIQTAFDATGTRKNGRGGLIEIFTSSLLELCSLDQQVRFNAMIRYPER